MRKLDLHSGGMDLVTLEDNLSSNTKREAWAADLKRMEARGVPHYSILADPGYCRAALEDGKAHVFTDKAQNVIFFGFDECLGDPDGDCKCKNGTPSPLRAMKCAGILNGNFSNEIIAQNTLQKKRVVGDKFLETEAIAISKEWVAIMQKMEQSGRNPVPYRYFLTDVTPVTLTSFVSDNAAWLIAIGAALAIALTGGLLTGVVLGPAFKLLTNLSQKLASGQPVTFVDLADSALALAPVVLGSDSKSGKLEVLGADVQKLVKTGSGIYQAYQKNDYLAISNYLGLFNNNSKITQALKFIQNKDVTGLAAMSGIPVAEVEKVITGFKQNEMVKGLCLDYERLKNQSNVLGSGLIHSEVQQYVINAIASPKAQKEIANIASAIPNAFGATQLITQNEKLAINEYKGLINILQNEKIPSKSLDRLTKLAIIKDADKFAKNGGKGYVIPSGIPEKLIGEIAYTVPKAVPGIYVTVPKEKVKHSLEFP